MVREGSWLRCVPLGLLESLQRLALQTRYEVAAGQHERAIWQVSEKVKMAELMPGALASTKRLLSIDREEVAAALESELQAFIAQILTPEARRGMEVFLGVSK